MGYLLDAAIILFIAVMILKSSRSTILKVLTDTGCLIFTLIASSRISVLLSSAFFQFFFRNSIASKIELNIEKIAVMYGSSSTVERILRFMPGFVNEGAMEYGLVTEENSAAIDRIIQNESSAEASAAIADMLAGPVIEGIFRAVFLVIFSFFFFYIYRSFCSVIENSVVSPAVCYVDSVFGGVFGGIRAILILLVVMASISLILPVMGNTDVIVNNCIEKSLLGRILYDNNLLNFYIGNIKIIG